MKDFTKNERKDEVRVFENEQFGQVRIVMDENNEPLFCAKDVCDALKHTNSRRAIAKLVDEADVTKRYTPTTSGN